MRNLLVRLSDRHRHLLHVVAQIVAGAFCVYWLFRTPVPNLAALFLAGIAAVMGFVDMRPINKAVYFVLIVCLIFIETRAINRDRADFAAQEASRRQEENKKFQEIADGIRATIAQSDSQFQSTNVATRKLIDNSTALAALSRQNIDAVTGGDTFCYVGASFIGPDFLLVITTSGTSPLHDVIVEQVDIDKSNAAVAKGNLTWPTIQGFTVDYPTVPFLSSTAGRILAQIPVGAGDERDLQFSFYSMNGIWGERLNLRKVNGQWLQAIKVSKELKPKGVKILYSYVPQEYPVVNGKVDW